MAWEDLSGEVAGLFDELSVPDLRESPSKTGLSITTRVMLTPERKAQLKRYRKRWCELSEARRQFLRVKRQIYRGWKPYLTCAHCRDIFAARPPGAGKGRQRVYCDANCAQNAYRARKRQKRAAL